MIESLAGTLFAIVIVVVLLLLFRRFVCWFLKIDLLLDLLVDIRQRLAEKETDAQHLWTVRVRNKLRPMRVAEYRLSETELRTWIEDGELRTEDALIRSPESAEFLQFDTPDQLLAEIARVEGTDSEQTPSES